MPHTSLSAARYRGQRERDLPGRPGDEDLLARQHGRRRYSRARVWSPACHDSGPGNPPTPMPASTGWSRSPRSGSCPVRYALALDSRDMDMMVSLFTPDVRVGRESSGAAALRDVVRQRRSASRRMSVHFVGNHIVDFDDADHATRHRVLPRRARSRRRRLGRGHAPVLGHLRARRRADRQGVVLRAAQVPAAGTWSTRSSGRPTAPASGPATTRSPPTSSPRRSSRGRRFWAEVGSDPFA